MKNLIKISSLVIAAINFYQPSFANFNAQDILVDNLKCVRQIVESADRHDINEIYARRDAAIVLTSQIYKNKEDVAALRQNYSECTSYRKIYLFKNTFYPKVSELNQALEITQKATEIVDNFFKPEIVCSVGGVSGMVVPGIGVGIEGKTGYCLGSNGRRWIFVRGGFGAGLGFGADGSFSLLAGEQPSSDVGFSTLYATITKRQSVGLIANMVKEGNSPESYGKNGTTGLGFGFGYTVSMMTSLNIKLIPLGTSEKTLLEMME